MEVFRQRSSSVKGHFWSKVFFQRFSSCTLAVTVQLSRKWIKLLEAWSFRQSACVEILLKNPAFDRSRYQFQDSSWLNHKNGRVTSNSFQITPSLFALRMTNARVTNHNNHWVPPSLTREWQIHVLRRFQKNPPHLGESLLSYFVSEYYPTTPHYITAHAEVLCDPVLCPALHRLTMSHPGGVECSRSTRMWV